MRARASNRSISLVCGGVLCLSVCLFGLLGQRHEDQLWDQLWLDNTDSATS